MIISFILETSIFHSTVIFSGELEVSLSYGMKCYRIKRNASMIRTLATYSRGLAPFVQRLYNAILWINHYPVDSAVRFLNSYPLDSDLSVG